MPCYRCGVRQTDPERGKSPWRRGVRHDQLVLVCPACQDGNWTADLQSCAKCGTVHLIRRLGQVECLDCGLVHEPAPAREHEHVPVLVPSRPARAGTSTGASPADGALAEEVGRALDRILGRR
jgi:uncharacterized Zn finger protein